jgi:magnesium-transporting ATPase (P-type)
MMSMVYDHDDTVSIMVKGAPEMLLDQCTQILDKGIVRTMTLQDKKNIINHTL